MSWIIGIDEAGRGPLAGPIAVGVVAMPVEKNEWRHWIGLKDSKQLSEKQREIWHAKIKISDVLHSVAIVGARVIDRVGITHAASVATLRAIARLGLKPNEAVVFLDWGLMIPDIWQQKQFVKGDENIPAIALASIVAKVTRDRYMCQVAKKFPRYGFEQHKGYGTRAHYDAITLHGTCPLHRLSFNLHERHSVI